MRRLPRLSGNLVWILALLLVSSPLRPARASWPFVGGQTSAMQTVASDADWGQPGTTAPPTGRKERRLGIALLALGLLRSATAAMHLVFSSSQHCGPQKRLDWSESGCKNLKRYGIAGMGLSAAFVLGGALELGRGVSFKRRHERWKRTHWDSFSSFSTWLPFGGSAVQGVQLGPRGR